MVKICFLKFLLISYLQFSFFVLNKLLAEEQKLLNEYNMEQQGKRIRQDLNHMRKSRHDLTTCKNKIHELIQRQEASERLQEKAAKFEK